MIYLQHFFVVVDVTVAKHIALKSVAGLDFRRPYTSTLTLIIVKFY